MNFIKLSLFLIFLDVLHGCARINETFYDYQIGTIFDKSFPVRDITFTKFNIRNFNDISYQDKKLLDKTVDNFALKKCGNLDYKKRDVVFDGGYHIRINIFCTNLNFDNKKYFKERKKIYEILNNRKKQDNIKPEIRYSRLHEIAGRKLQLILGWNDNLGIERISIDKNIVKIPSEQNSRFILKPKKGDFSTYLIEIYDISGNKTQKIVNFDNKKLNSNTFDVNTEGYDKNEQNSIYADSKEPLLEIISNQTKGLRGTITGIVRDDIEVAEVTIDGKAIQLSDNGRFKYSTFVPSDGITLNIQVTDLAGLTSFKTVSLQRNDTNVSTSISFDRLNPLGKRVKGNANALALIVGVEGYENTNANALYADRDAKMFRDYASEKLGIPENRIKTLLNDKAEYAEILFTIKDWLRRASKTNKSDIYIFFAGHGLASDDGKDMYLLPYDGRPRLLNDTALMRDRLFKEIDEANPRSVTVFLDTCYSGTTRGTDMLIASRPIAIRALEQSIPDKFTVFSAAAGAQTSKPLEEAKHGMFSYFLMKGMEGDADSNNDNKITARELHTYVEQNVVQQSSGSQTPELQGDKDRVLVQFN